MSRPCKPDKEVKRNIVKAYLTDYELELLEKVCLSLNCSISHAIVSGIYSALTVIEHGEKGDD